MPEDHSEELTRVFNEVLEQFAFMFADPPDSEDINLEEDIAVASMSFQNASAGRLELIVPQSMGPVLSANVLGLDPDDELVLKAPYDALKELLNVTCGNILTAIAGDELVFDLTVPVVEERDREEWNALRARDNTIFCFVDDYPVLLHLDAPGL